MKTTLAILLLSGGFLCAQTPPAETDDAATRDEVLRNAVREAIAAGNTNKMPQPPAAAKPPAVKPSVPSVVKASADLPPVTNVTPDKSAGLMDVPPATLPSTSTPAMTPPAIPLPAAPSPAVATTTPAASPALPVVATPPPMPVITPPALPTIAAAPAATVPAATVAQTTPTPPNRRFFRTPGTPDATNAAAAPAAQPGVAAAPALPAPGAPPQPPPFSAVPTAPMLPPPAKPPEQIIPAGEINFPAVDINQVLAVYAELVGRTILRPAALPGGVITLKTQTPLTKTEAIQALNSVLSMNGITMINVPGDKFVKAVPNGQVFQEAEVFDGRDHNQLPEMGEYVTHIVHVQNAKPSELVPILQGFAKIPNSLLAIDSSGILIIRDYAENVKRMLELIEQIDVTVPLDFESAVIPIKYALASDIASALGSLGGGGGTSIGGHSGASSGATRSGTTLGSPGGGLGQPGGGIGGIGGLGSTPGSPGYNQANPGLGGQPGAAAGQRATSFQDRLQGIIRRASQSGDFNILGQTKIIADERTNSLLVFAGKQDMEMITNIIGKLDVVLAQVLIEAIIMEVTLTDDKSLGVSYLQKDPSHPGNYFNGVGAINNTSGGSGWLSPQNFAAVGTNAVANVPSGFSYLARFGGDFDATVTAAADDGKINILSRPRIQTSHAVTASLQIGDTVPYVTGTYFNGVNGTPSSQYQQTFVGINLQVTPLINPDGLVVMDIVQDVQQLGPTTMIDGNAVPTTTKRTAQAKVSVRDRDTIILGGFISTSRTTSKSGVPYLKDIPLLGLLFNSSSDMKKRTELVVLIRPTVLPTPETAAFVARKEQDKMPLLKAAEAEARAERLKLQKQADKIVLPPDVQ